MKKIRKIAISGFLALALAFGGVGLKGLIDEREKEVEKIRVEFPEKVIQNNDFWNAKNHSEALTIYYNIMADYAKSIGYNGPGSAAWMPRKLKDIEGKLIRKFYNSEAIRGEFSRKDSSGRKELYNLLLEYGY